MRCPWFWRPRARAVALLMVLCMVLAHFGRAALAGAQGSMAIVTGAEHVFIRRGPGTEFPPFANLSAGAKVEIQEMRGEWARVLTASGQSGYVRSNFLALATEQRPVSAPTAITATAAPRAPSATATSRVTSPTAGATRQTAAPQQTGQAAGASPESQRVLEDSTPARGGSDQVPTPSLSSSPSRNELEKLHADLVRLNSSVEQLQHLLNLVSARESPLPLAGTSAEGSSMLVSTGILLGAVGLCVGWLLGNAYGRRQERGRRPRVRL